LAIATVSSDTREPTAANALQGEQQPPASDELDRPITTRWLMRFTGPTVFSFLLFSVFSMVDGIFAARLIDPIALAAVNIAWPFIGFAMAVTFMLSTGGAALVGKKLGEGKPDEARSDFTFLTAVAVLVAFGLAAFAWFFPDALLAVLGADAQMAPLVNEYLRPMVLLSPLAMLGFYFQQFFVTEGRPNMGLYVTAVGGVINIVFNWLFIGELGWGLRGAALATGIGWVVPAAIGLWFFWHSRKGRLLCFSRMNASWRVLGTSAFNGVSEMITMVAAAVIVVMMNNIVIRLVGPAGVSAVAIMFVVTGLVIQMLLGFAYGVAPIISFNLGAGRRDRLRKVVRRSLVIMTTGAVVFTALGWLIASPLARIYVDRGTDVYEMAVHGIRVTLVGLVLISVNAYGTVLFTALNNGFVSGLLAVMRTVVFSVATLALLPQWFGMEGVWWAWPASEVLALVLTVFFLLRKAQRYGYA